MRGSSGEYFQAVAADPFRAPSFFEDLNNVTAPTPDAIHFVDQARMAPEASGIIVAQGPGARERALILEDVHRDVANPPGGYRVATEGELGQLGLRPHQLSAIGGSYGARVYVRSAGGATDVVVALRSDRVHNAPSLRAAETKGVTYTVIAGPVVPDQRNATPFSPPNPTGRSALLAAFDLSGERLSTVQAGGVLVAAALYGRMPG